MFIVFEGIDGTGKSTQARMLTQSIQGAYLTTEPTSSPIGKLIRERLYQGETDTHVMRRLFAADRQDHVNTVIQPILKEGGIVVSDRYLLSSMAYQSESLYIQTQITDILRINGMGKELPVPDLTIYLDILPERIMERLQARQRELDSFEKLEHLIAVREKYQAAIERVRRLGWTISEVSGEGTPEYVHSRIVQIVQTHLDRLAR